MWSRSAKMRARSERATSRSGPLVSISGTAPLRQIQSTTLQVSGKDRFMENWTWGLALIALTVGIHASGIVSMALVLHSIGIRVESQRLKLRRLFVILTGLIGTVGLLLAVLHGIEAGFWAAAYWWVDALASPEEAVLYSLDSITTLAASGLTLPQHWRKWAHWRRRTACFCSALARPLCSE